MPREELQDKSFKGLGISPGLFNRIESLGFEHPTPIQFKTIPLGISGEDIIGIAQTGSGKTLAFTVPLLEKVAKTGKLGLVLLPTRELAVQVQETMMKLLGKDSNLRTALVIGGTNPGPQIKQLKQRPHVIIATPGRLIDLEEQGFVRLQDVCVMVLDEADRMLDMGFEPQLRQIFAKLPEQRQTFLFSATMPDEIADIAKTYMYQPVRVEVAKPGTTAKGIRQEMYLVQNDDKKELLERMIKETTGPVLVFSRTKHGAKKLARNLRQAGFRADEIHSNRSQNQRQKALNAFASGKVRVLVATDIAARGIDVSDIELVINFDLPDQIDDYVHRIGRTGRAGKKGKAVSYATKNQVRDIAQIQKLVGQEIPLFAADGSSLPPVKTAASGPRPSRKQGGGRRRGPKPEGGWHKKRSRRSGHGGRKRSGGNNRR